MKKLILLLVFLAGNSFAFGYPQVGYVIENSIPDKDHVALKSGDQAIISGKICLKRYVKIGTHDYYKCQHTDWNKVKIQAFFPDLNNEVSNQIVFNKQGKELHYSYQTPELEDISENRLILIIGSLKDKTKRLLFLQSKINKRIVYLERIISHFEKIGVPNRTLDFFRAYVTRLKQMIVKIETVIAQDPNILARNYYSLLVDGKCLAPSEHASTFGGIRMSLEVNPGSGIGGEGVVLNAKLFNMSHMSFTPPGYGFWHGEGHEKGNKYQVVISHKGEELYKSEKFELPVGTQKEHSLNITNLDSNIENNLTFDLIQARKSYIPFFSKKGWGRIEQLIPVADPSTINQDPTADFSYDPLTPKAVDHAVNFDGSLSQDPDGSIVKYSWDFGDGTTTTGVQAEHTYSEQGYYQVKLLVEDDYGAVNETIKTITVLPPNVSPDAKFLIAPMNGVVGQEISFDATESNDSDGEITSYQWSFSDGQNLEGGVVSRTFQTHGSYQVTLSIADNDGAKTDLGKDFTINSIPTSSFVYNPQTGKAPFAAHFSSTSTDLDGTIISHQWHFSDGGQISGAEVQHTFANQGIYNVRLVVTDDKGAIAESSQSVEVLAPNVAPSAAFSFTPQTGEAPLQINLDASASSDSDGEITAYSWSFSDGGNTNGINSSYTFQSPGEYQITLVVIDNDGATDTTFKKVTVLVPNIAPVASFTISPESGKAPLEVAFSGEASSDQDGVIVSYSWEISNGAILKGATPQYTFADSGIYTVKLVVTDDDGAVSETVKTVTVKAANVPPVANFTFSPKEGSNPLAVLLDGSESLDSDGEIANYNWDFGDGQNSGGKVVAHLYENPGDYNIILTIKDDEGLTSQITKTITILDAATRPNLSPVASFYYLGSGEMLETYFVFQGYDIDGKITAAEYQFPDGSKKKVANFSSSTFTYHKFESSGVHNVSLTVYDDDGDSSTYNLPVEVGTGGNLTPNSDFRFQQTAPLTAYFNLLDIFDPEDKLDSITINFGDGEEATLSDMRQISHVYPSAGNYEVVVSVTDEDGGVKEKTITIEVDENDPNLDTNLLNYYNDQVRFQESNVRLNMECLGWEQYSTCFGQISDPEKKIEKLQINWGDGQVEELAVAPDGSFDLNHQYEDWGKKNIVLISEIDGETPQMNFTQLNIKDPSLPTALMYCSSNGLEISCNGTGSYSSSGDITSYQWDFGDGITATGGQVSHTYSQEGTYKVTIKVTDDQSQSGSMEIPYYVGVFESVDPTAQFSCYSEQDYRIYCDAFYSYDYDGEITEYRWEMGDGVIKNGVNIDHVYSRGGMQTIKLTVTDNQGISSLLEQDIMVMGPINLAPVALFNCQENGPLTLNCSADSSYDQDGLIVSYAWDFGDGQTSTDKNTNHTFAASGEYLISLVVVDDLGVSNIYQQTITVVEPINDPLEAIIECNFNDELHVTCSATSPYNPDGIVLNYEWNLGDGTILSGQNVTHDYQDYQVYNITLSVADQDGNTRDHSITVKTNPVPVASFDISASDANPPYEATLDASLSSDDSSISSYIWNFGDGETLTTRLPVIQHIYHSAGSYTVKLIVVDDEGATHLTTQEIRINHAPVINLNVSPVTGNPSLSVSFDASLSTDDRSIIEYRWDFGDGNSSTTTSPVTTHEYSISGLYNAVLTLVDDEGMQSQKSTSIRVNSSPTAFVSGTPLEGDFPLNVSFTAKNSSDDSKIDFYEWNFGDGTTEVTTESAIKHVFTQAGTFNVVLTVTDDQGLVSSNSLTVTTQENISPIADFSFQLENTNAPAKIKLDASASSDDKSIKEYRWDFGDGATQSVSYAQVEHQYDLAGTYSVKLEVIDNQGGSSESTQPIIVSSNESPTANYSISTNSGDIPHGVIFDASLSSDDEGIVEYQWDFGDGKSETTSSVAISHVFTEVGSFEVILTVRDRQGSEKSITQVITTTEPVAPQDQTPPTIVITPESGIVSSVNETITITIEDTESAIDYDKLLVKLNDVEVPEANIQIDSISNIVEVTFNSAFPLSREKVNVLGVFASDEYANVANAISYYEVVLVDDEAPIINFSPNGGELSTLTPTIEVYLSDQSGIDYSSLVITLNGIEIPTANIEVQQEQNSIEVSFDELFPLSDQQFSIMRVVLSDAHGNQGIGEVGFDTINREVVVLSGNDFEGGNAHTCILLSDGNVKCWGVNNYGQLGLGYTSVGTLGTGLSPSEMPNVELGGKVKQVVTGGSFSCALLVNGDVRCWGYPGAYLGIGSYSCIGDDEVPADLPPISLGGVTTQIAAGINHVCALLESGDIRCWGNNYSGELGQGDTTQIGINEVPSSVPTIDLGGKAIYVTAGYSYTCALLESGSIRCWGLNSSGQLGLGHRNNIGDNESPIAAQPVDVGGIAKQVEIGSYHACALLESGSVRCWGQDRYQGRLGLGTAVSSIGDDELPSSQPALSFTYEIEFLSLGGDSTCALDVNGDVHCWGYNNYGQLGQGHTDTIGDNEDVTSLAPVNVGGKVIKIGSGESHHCASLENGEIRCWGYNGSGQIGISRENLGDDETPNSREQVGISNVVEVSSNQSYATCALFADKSTKCWGNNAYGLLGLGYSSPYTPDNTPINQLSSINLGCNAKSIVPGVNHSCAICENGSLKCWGMGGYGALGIQTSNHVYDPSTVVPISFNSPVKQVGIGYALTCVLLENGDVRCWGLNSSGQLGLGHKDNIGDDESIHSVGPISLGTPATQISVSNAHVCALLSNGTARCWGRNAYNGELGLGHTDNIGDDELPNSVPAISLGGTPIQISAGLYHTCALLSGGDVRCWGRNFIGQLGLATTETWSLSRFQIPTERPLVDLGGKAIQISAGADSTCALMENHQVKCWGTNNYGQLGLGHTDIIGDDEHPSSTPTIDLGGDATSVFISQNHACALMDDATIRCWGSNVNGELGYPENYYVGNDEVPADVDPIQFGGVSSPVHSFFTATPHAGPSPLHVDFDASGTYSDEGEIEKYTWNFGDGETEEGVEPNTSHIYSDVGVYVVRLTARDTAGNEHYFERIITASQEDNFLLARAEISLDGDHAPLTAQFDGSFSIDANGTIVSYEWDFGDGATDISFTPAISHSYSEVGNYVAYLTVVDDEGNRKTSDPIIVVALAENQMPIAKANCELVLNTMSCNASGSVDYDGTIGNYEWDLGNGDKIFSESISYTYPQPGSGLYSIKLTVTDNRGGAGEDNFQIQTDFSQPVISSSIIEEVLTSTPLFSIPVTVTDDSLTTTTIVHNGIEIAWLDEASFDQNVYLQEGVNEFEIRSVDGAGNEATPITLPSIIFDTTGPVLSSIMPGESTKVESLTFKVSGQSDEALASISVNGIPLTIGEDKKSFSGFYTIPEEMDFSLTYEATDLVGNISSVSVDSGVILSIFTRSLISVNHAPLQGKLIVRGAAGSCRYPGLEVVLDSGFFNTEVATCLGDGSFELETDYFLTAELSATHPRSGDEEEVPLTFQIGETTLSGVVKNIDGLPLKGVTISIFNTNVSTVTNEEGIFHINDCVTGDHKIVVDGTTIPAELLIPSGETEPDRSYSKVNLAFSIGRGQNNVFPKEIVLAPLMKEGAALVDQDGGIVSSIQVPGVELNIPAGSITFPDGSAGGAINIIEVSKDKTTIPVPDYAEPDTVIALEPSGVVFSQPVELTLPNVNELPAGMEVVILSKNSIKGIWELDGAAKVSEDGSSIVTKPGMGITHFSEVYAAPLGPQIGQVGSQDNPGADTFNGAVTSKIQLPSYRALGQDITPGLIYRSTWAKPTTVISNYIQGPRYVVQRSGAGQFTFSASAWLEEKYLTPEWIDVQFFSENIISQAETPSGKMRFQGQIDDSLISYSMDLSDFDTGVHAYRSRYEIKLKHMTIRTRKSGLATLSGVSEVTSTMRETRILNKVFPEDMSGHLYIQDKRRSPAGAGWKIGGVQKLVNPGENRLMVEEGNGQISTYVINNTIETIYENTHGIKSIDIKDTDNSTVVDGENNLIHVDLTSGDQLSTEVMPDAGEGRFGIAQNNIAHVSFLFFKTKMRTCIHYMQDYRLIADASQIINIGNDNYVITDNAGVVYQYKDGELTPIGGGKALVNWQIPNSKDETEYEFCRRGNVTCGDRNRTGENPFKCFYAVPSEGDFYDSGFSGDGLIYYPSEDPTSKFPITQLNTPMGIIPGLESNTYIVADSGNSRLRTIDLNNGVIYTIAGKGMNMDWGDGGLAINAGIDHPRGLVYDNRSGDLYVTTGSGKIRRIDNTGRIWTYAGGSRECDDCHAEDIRFNQPYGMAIDYENNYLYVADTGNNRIVQIDFETKQAVTVAGDRSCRQTNIGDGGAAIGASICSPEHVGVDKDNNLLVLDNGHGRIRRVKFKATEDGITSYVTTTNDLSQIRRNADGRYERTYRNGSVAAFDDDGLQISFRDRTNRLAMFEYQDEKLITMVDQAGSRITYNYNGELLASIVDPAGRETFFNYDGNFLESVEFPDGTSREFIYNENGLLEEEINQRDLSTRYDYNDWFRIQSITLPDNSKIEVSDSGSKTVGNNFQGGSIGQLQNIGGQDSEAFDGIKDARDIATYYEKDINGFITKITIGEGDEEEITEVHRNGFGKPLKIIRPDGSQVNYVYDQRTQDLLEETDTSIGATTKAAYNEFGQLISQTDVKGNISRNIYDENTGQILKKINVLGQETQYYYEDRFGLATASKDNIGRITYIDRDEFGNTIRVTSADGSNTYYKRDAAGNIISSTNEEGQVTKYEFDLFNRLTLVVTPKAERTEYQYLPTGELHKVIDPYGRVTTYVNDEIGRAIEKIDPLGNKTIMSYDGNGNLTRMVDPNGNEQILEYNKKDQLIKKDLADNSYEITYDVRGNVSQVKNNHSQIDFSYEHYSSGDVISSVRSQGLGAYSDMPAVDLDYGYDIAGNRISLIDPTGETTYTFDISNRLEQIVNHKGESFSFDFDNANRLVEIERPGSTTSLVFDVINFMTGISHRSGSTVIGSFENERNLLGNRIRTRTPAGEYNFGSDDNNQIISASNPEVTSSYALETFSYDSNGNRISSQLGEYSFDQYRQRIVEDYHFVYVHDHNGNMTSKQAKLKNTTENYIYTSENQLKRVEFYEGVELVKRIKYGHDALGRRMSKEIVDYRNTDKSFVRRYVYDGDDILLEYDGENKILAKYTHSGLTADDVLSVDITSDGVLAGTGRVSGSYFFLKDSLGSIVDITNSQGDKIQHIVYSAFGKILKIEDGMGNETNQPYVLPFFAFTGREYDKETGLYHFRARVYDPALGRFLQSDPDPGHSQNPITLINKYVYSGNNPINISDPTGMSFWKDLGRVAVVIGAFYLGAYVGGLAAAYLGFSAGTAGAMIVGALFGSAAGGALGAIAYELLDLGTAEDGFYIGAIAGAIGGFAKGAGWLGDYEVKKYKPGRLKKGIERFLNKQVKKQLPGSTPNITFPSGTDFTRFLAKLEPYVVGVGAGVYANKLVYDCATGNCVIPMQKKKWKF